MYKVCGCWFFASRGGVAFAVASEANLPIRFIGAGEGLKDLKPFKSIGYQEIINHLKGNLNSQEMIEKIQQRTRRYAKRQLTWFKKESNIEWFQPSKVSRVLDRIKVFLEK